MNGSAVLAGATVPGGDPEEPGESATIEASIGGLAKVRVMLIDTGAVFVAALCAN